MKRFIKFAATTFSVFAISTGAVSTFTPEVLAQTTSDEIETSVVKLIQEIIPYETQIIEDNTLTKGTTVISQQGSTGIKELTVEQTLVGDQITSEVVTNEKIVAAPVVHIIKQGTKAANTIVCEFSGVEYEFTDKYTMHATAYTDVENAPWNGITATGLPTFIGMVAVDRNVIPLGTILYVDGYGVAVAGDVGGAIDDWDIDLFMHSYSDAMEFGRKNLTVYKLANQDIDVQTLRAHENY
ncbi:G5 and 3D domain-containing protein [Candidatus Epulonipiscium viviparus]|uniref:G5 and 3D domain-containing protein n=1 Tax=Candidatus Epulonipiscium viviparus TaxID=420336 RepID=UPI00273807E2|nr:3D domain-containing protein [Candidatus Epulopiscium viviparus]